MPAWGAEQTFYSPGGIMKRAIAAVVTAVAATGSMWLATVPAYAKPAPKPPTATLRSMPQWTYLAGGEFAVITKCSVRKDIRVIFSPLLYRPVLVPGAGNLLIRVTGKTRPGTYTMSTRWSSRRSGCASSWRAGRDRRPACRGTSSPT